MLKFLERRCGVSATIARLLSFSFGHESRSPYLRKNERSTRAWSGECLSRCERHSNVHRARRFATFWLNLPRTDSSRSDATTANWNSLITTYLAICYAIDQLPRGKFCMELLPLHVPHPFFFSVSVTGMIDSPLRRPARKTVLCLCERTKTYANWEKMSVELLRTSSRKVAMSLTCLRRHTRDEVLAVLATVPDSVV